MKSLKVCVITLNTKKYAGSCWNSLNAIAVMMVSGHQYEDDYDDEEYEEGSDGEIFSDEEEEEDIEGVEYEEEIIITPKTYEDYETLFKKVEPASVDTDTEALIERELMKLPRPETSESSQKVESEVVHVDEDEVDHGEEEEYEDEELLEEEEYIEEEEELEPENADDIEELSEEGKKKNYRHT